MIDRLCILETNKNKYSSHHKDQGTNLNASRSRNYWKIMEIQNQEDFNEKWEKKSKNSKKEIKIMYLNRFLRLSRVV